MLEKRLWQRIRLWQVNILLYAVIAILGITTWRPLVWSSHALPNYVDGSIDTPMERKLYRKARRIILSGKSDISRAKSLLEQSIAIDPNAEGRYWLGKYYLAVGDQHQSAQAYEAYLEIDPTKRDTYLDLAQIYTSMGRLNDAQKILQRGVQFYQKNVEDLRPRPLAEIRRKYNKKAKKVYQYALSSLPRLRAALHN